MANISGSDVVNDPTLVYDQYSQGDTNVENFFVNENLPPPSGVVTTVNGIFGPVVNITGGATGLAFSTGANPSALSGTLDVDNGGTGRTTLTNHGVVIGAAASPVNVTSAGTAGQVLTSNGASADPTFQTGTSGTVTSFSATPTGIFDVANPTTTPALSLDNQSANTVLAGPSSGGATTPAFRALVDADLPQSTWSTYTPTVTAQTGTITTSSATGRFKQLSGKTMVAEVDVTITAAGTGAGSLLVTLPSNAAAHNYTGSSYEYAATGKNGGALILPATFGAGVVAMRDASAATYIVSGNSVAATIVYELA